LQIPQSCQADAFTPRKEIVMSEPTSLVVDGENIASEPLERGDVIGSGIIHINDRGIGDEPMVPFGGVTSSGYGRFGETAGIDSFTEQR
jgi:acyl-CoA reductase-like NAD-dependent aldehyde dehydrogenase